MTQSPPTRTIVADAEEMGRVAADRVTQQVRERPHAVLALPTGSTPLPMFRELLLRTDRGELDLSRITLVCLDEYLGVGPDDPNSLTGWLYDAFITPAGLRPDQLLIVPAMSAEPEAAAAAYEAAVAERGGLDLAVLGLGPNGHIAYNEPGSTADSRTRVLRLSPESVAQASAYWSDTQPIPSLAMTMGVGTLLEARRIVLIVTGESKAEKLRQTLEEPMSADVPASWLRLVADRVEVIADRAAASALMS